jgi:hypothetical protein
VTLLLAGALAALSLVFAFRTLASAGRTLRSLQQVEADPFEQRLADKERRLVLSLARRSVLGVGRASLFAGTGLGVWALTGGSAHYLEAGVAFGLGFVSWAGCGEAQRRIGSLADAARVPRQRQGVDRSERTG